jgi:uncharacterized repeat protein (TIGR01451 family)
MTIVVTVHPDAVTDVVTDELIMHDDASVSSDTLDLNNSNNLDTEDTTVQAEADLGLVKLALGTPIAGTDITYEYHISNAGPSVSRDVTFRDLLPPGVEFLNAFVDVEGGVGGVPLPCTLNAGINELLCPLGDIPPTNGVPILILVNVHIAADVPEGTLLTNNADVLLSDTPDPDTDNNSDEASVVVGTRADIQVTKVADSNTYKSSSIVTYTITVRNNGPSDAQGVAMTDDLPIKKQDRVFVFSFGSACARPPGGTLLTCSMGTIPAGGSKIIMIALELKGSRGIVSNTADASTTTTDPDLTNNSSTAVVVIGQLPKP